jgi:4-amino-4-deoxy-L-arabinose transferase-like glycosyltransferase
LSRSVRVRSLQPDWALVAIAAAALVIRVVYTIELGQDVELGISDATFYSGAANSLARGEGYIDMWRALATGEATPTAHHPPGWPALLGVFAFFGVETELGHRLVGALVGAAVVLVIGLVGRRVGGRRVGLVAAGMAAVHPTLVAADGSLMSETLAGLFVLFILLLGFRLLDRPTAARAAALGVVIGAGALVRGEALLYLFLLAVPVAVMVARRTADGRQAFLRVAGVTALGVACVVLPWTARNYVQLDGFVLISINDSSVLAGANCEPAYHGPGIGGWHISCAAAHEDDPLPEVEEAARWREDAITYARGNLERLPIVVPARVARTWGFYQPLPPVAEGRHEGVQTAGTLAWLGLLLPLGAAGAVVLARRRQSVQLLVLLAPVAAATIVSIIGFGMLRFRHTMELTAILLAAVAVDAALRATARERRAPEPALHEHARS